MEDKSDIVKVYSGTQVSATLLKAELEKVGVIPLLKDDFSSDITGFFGNTPSMVDVYVSEDDLKAARPIVEGFQQLNST